MASVTKEVRNGRNLFRVEFRDKNGQRRKIRLGEIARRDADAFAVKVQAIVSADITGNCLPPAIAHWLSEIGDPIHQKLAQAGLCTPRDQSTIQDWLTTYIDSRKGTIADKSLEILEQTKAKLVEHFGADKPLREITPTEAHAFRKWLADSYAQATVSNHIKKTRQFFIAAVKAKLIAESPFADVVAGTQVNEKRSIYIPVDIVEKAIGMAPDAQWRCIIALCRYGGLRCPSEVLALKWSDIDFEKNVMTIQEGKTKKRQMPILPELRIYLSEAFDPENIRVISLYRLSNFNLRKRFLQILEKAGVKPWERIFHNMRGSLQTDLTDRFPLHVVTAWLGNSAKIATDHYLKITPEHLERALQGVGQQVGTQPPATNDMARNQPQPIPLFPEVGENVGELQTIEYTRRDSNP